MAIQPRKVPPHRTGYRPKKKLMPPPVPAGEYLAALRKLRLKWGTNNRPYLVASFQLLEPGLPLGRWASACVFGAYAGEFFQSSRLEPLGFPHGELLVQEFDDILGKGYYSPISESRVDEVVLAFVDIEPAPDQPEWLRVEDMEKWRFTPDDHPEVKTYLHELVLHNIQSEY